MDEKKKFYEELLGKYEAMGKEKYNLEMTVILPFEATEDHRNYNSLTDDVVKQEMYPEQFEAYAKYNALEDKRKHFLGELVKSAQGLMNELGEAQQKAKAKLETVKAHIEKIDKENEERQTKIDAIKASQEYKDGDETAKLEVNKLISEIKNANFYKGKVENSIKDTSKKINEMQEEMDNLKAKWKDEITYYTPTQDTPPEGQSQGDNQEEQKDNQDNKDNQENKDSKNNRETKGKNGNNVVYYSGDNLQPDQPEQSEQSETQQGDNQEQGLSVAEFDKLYARAKQGKLKEGDYDKIAEILSDKASYKKYGITTGVLFNKGKVLLKALGKEFANASTKAHKDAFGLESELTKDNIGARTLESWSSLSKLMKEPDTKISAEAMFKNVMAVDEKDLDTDEKKELYKQAEAELKKYAALRGAIATYSEVTNERKQERGSWFNSRKKDAAKLPAPKDESTANYISVVDLSSKLGKETNPPSKTDVDLAEKTVQQTKEPGKEI